MNNTNKQIAKIVVFVLGVVIPLRLFIGEPCRVPSASMENTIFAGDWLWIDKATYGACLPKRWADIPLLNAFTWIRPLREADGRVDWGYNRFPGLAKPKTSDLIVFLSLENERYTLIKRLIGIPGDQITIYNGRVKVNGHVLLFPAAVLPTVSKDTASLAGFPKETAWNIHTYGPIQVPGKGACITLTDSNYPYLKEIIEREGNTIYKRKNLICINGQVVSSYLFKYDYYFVLGDNRSGSRDSRYFGFVAEHAIIGKVNYVLLSLTKKDDEVTMPPLHRLFHSLK